MNVLSISKSPISFKGEYKTADVLRLLTGYPYKNQSIEGTMVKELTGLDIHSDEFCSSLPKNSSYLFVYLSIINACQEEILKQHPELKETYDSFDCRLHLNEGKKAQDNWFKAQLKKLSSGMTIQPFTLDSESLRKSYKSIETTFNAIF